MRKSLFFVYAFVIFIILNIIPHKITINNKIKNEFSVKFKNKII